jgi:chemotaxis family two-component system response regulator Rcp1
MENGMYMVGELRAMTKEKAPGTINLLLIEDNAADVRMVVEGLKTALPTVTLSVTRDGEEAIRFLRREGEYQSARRPDLILLDLRLPKKSGFEVLREIKEDRTISDIPVVVHTSSEVDTDIQRAYALHANSYINKARQLDDLTTTMQALVDFWVTVAKLPPRAGTEKRYD